MTTLLSAKKLTKSFLYPKPSELLKGVSLELYPQHSIAITGHSGVGKSSLLHILGTLDEPTSGTLTIVGTQVKKERIPFLRNRHIGFIFQNFNLLEDYSILQNVLMPAWIAKKETGKNTRIYNRALELLEKVNMHERHHFPVKLLSGGEKQRVAIARALLNDPEILLADEPTGSLDEANAETIHDLLLYCVEDLGKGLIVATHNPSLAKRCHKTFHLHDGKLQ